MMLGILALVLFFGLYPQPLLDATGDVMAGVQGLFNAARTGVTAFVPGGGR